MKQNKKKRLSTLEWFVKIREFLLTNQPTTPSEIMKKVKIPKATFYEKYKKDEGLLEYLERLGLIKKVNNKIANFDYENLLEIEEKIKECVDSEMKSNSPAKMMFLNLKILGAEVGKDPESPEFLRAFSNFVKKSYKYEWTIYIMKIEAGSSSIWC